MKEMVDTVMIDGVVNHRTNIPVPDKVPLQLYMTSIGWKAMITRYYDATIAKLS